MKTKKKAAIVKSFMNMEQEVIHILQMKGLNDIIILGNMLAVILFCFVLLIFVIAKLGNSSNTIYQDGG